MLKLAHVNEHNPVGAVGKKSGLGRQGIVAGFILFLCIVLVGCQTLDPYTDEVQTSKATTGTVIGGLGGAAVGALVGGRDGALIGLGIGALAGGVWEWTESSNGARGVLKGGSDAERNPANLRAAARRTEDPTSAHADDGFRCARDVEEWETDGITNSVTTGEAHGLPRR